MQREKENKIAETDLIVLELYLQTYLRTTLYSHLQTDLKKENFFSFFNLKTQVPWKDFTVIKQGLFFEKFVRKLKEVDVDYFSDLAQSKDLGYLVTCSIQYDDNLGLKSSLDYSDFPFFR